MRKFSCLLLLIILAVSCNKEKEFDYSLVYTGEVTEIKNDGAVFSAKIVDLSKLEVIEHGFVWDEKTNPTIENSEKYVIIETPRIGVFNQHISTTLKAGTKYYVRTYIKNTKYVTYGNEVVFTSLGSLAPQILDFIPKTGNLNDSITIIGHNFSYKASNNHVQIGEFQASVIKANQDTLIVKVPERLNSLSSLISISIQGNKAISTDLFNLIPPVISDFQEKIGTFGSLVTIVGNNFLANPSTLKVYFDNFNARITDIQNQSIKVFVPDSLNKRQSIIKVRMNNITATSIDNFQLAPLTITDFTPKIAITGSTISLTGNNFSPIASNNIVTIGGHILTVTKASLNKLEVVLPFQNNVIYPSRKVPIIIETIGEIKKYNDSLLIDDDWFRIKNAPTSISNSGFGYSYCNCFTYKGKAYVGLNNKSLFWEYNPITDEWSKLADFPGKPRYQGVGFVIGENLYFGTGSSPHPYYEYFNDWWKYSFVDNTWSQLSNFSGEKRSGAVAFQINNFGYLGTGLGVGVLVYYSNFWKYDPSVDSWTRIADYPKEMWNGIAIANSTEAYTGLGMNFYSCIKYMYKYNPDSNIWQTIADFPYGCDNNNPMGFCINNKVYIKTDHTQDFYFYDDSNNIWNKMPERMISGINYGISFSLNNKVYVGLGLCNSMWVFDPSR